MSDLFGEGNRYWAKRKLSLIPAFPCQINQISGKQSTKQVFFIPAQKMFELFKFERDFDGTNHVTRYLVTSDAIYKKLCSTCCSSQINH